MPPILHRNPIISIDSDATHQHSLTQVATHNQERRLVDKISDHISIRATKHTLLPNPSQVKRGINVVQRIALDQYQVSSPTGLDLAAISEVEALCVEIGRSS
jgi:hypothetical protein